MSDAAATLSHSDETDAASGAGDRARLLDAQLAILTRLADIGMSIAAALERKAADVADATPVGEIALSYSRVARGVRQALLLQSKLVQDFDRPAAAKPGASAETDPQGGDDIYPYEAYWADGEPLSRSAKRRVTRDNVRALAEDRGLDAETIERLEVEAVERLQDKVLFPPYPEPGNRRFRAVLAQICEDLGLKDGAEGFPADAQPPGPAARPQDEDLEPPRLQSLPRAPTWLSG